MVLKIKFRALLTLCSEPIENGLLIVENGNIIKISSEALNTNTNNVLDLSDHLLMPGFVNAHCHIGLTALANKLLPGNNFSKWNYSYRKHYAFFWLHIAIRIVTFIIFNSCS